MSSSFLNGLKLTVARKNRALPDLIRRRNKLLLRLEEQRKLAFAKSESKHYAPKRMRSFLDPESGARIVKEVPIRIKPWFWIGEKGETLLAVQYGSRKIELIKGKNAIDCGESKNLLNVLDAVISAVHNGELDVQLENLSTKLRDGFKK